MRSVNERDPIHHPFLSIHIQVLHTLTQKLLKIKPTEANVYCEIVGMVKKSEQGW